MKEKEHYQRERGRGSGINSLTTVTLDKYSRTSGKVISAKKKEIIRPTRLVTIALYVQHDIVLGGYT